MGFWRKMTNAFHRPQLQQDIADELAFHLEEREQMNRARGMTPAEAQMAARRQFGNLTLAVEQTTGAELMSWLESTIRDTRLTLRILAKSRLFTAVALLTLALGIGANTAVFTLMKLIVLDALPVSQPQRLVVLHDDGPEQRGYGNRMGNALSSAFSYPAYQDLRPASSDIFSDIVAFAGGGGFSATLTTMSNAERILPEYISANYFSVLGVHPWRGRLLAEADDLPSSDAAIVLSYGFWQHQFGGDPKILHQTVRLNNVPCLVVGITAPSFYGVSLGQVTDVYVPLALTHRLSPKGKDPLEDRNYSWLALVGRMKPGVTLAHAQTALTVIYPAVRDKQLADIPGSPWPGFLEAFKHQFISLTPGGQGYSTLREGLEKPLAYIFAMTGIFLLITLVNIANLLIARGSRRTQEMAVRLSLGAPRSALVRQLVIESCVLAGIGGLCGIALAYVATPVLLFQFASDLSQAGINVHPDVPVLILAFAASLASGLFFGLAPAWQSARTRVSESLKRETGTHTARAQWGRRILVGSQIALSFVLLVSALLFAKSLHNLRHIDVGFRTDHLLRFKLDPTSAGYAGVAAANFVESVRQKVALLPGVQDLAIAETPIMENSDGGFNLAVEGYDPPTHADAQTRNDWVGPSFFSTLSIPLSAGRTYSDEEMQRGYKFAVVNETFVKHFFAGRNPIGRHFGIGGGRHGLPWTIVGVVRDSRYLSARGHIEPLMYLPYTLQDSLHELTFYARIGKSANSVMPLIRRTVQKLDARVPVSAFGTMEEQLDSQLSAERGLSVAANVFAVLAFFLAGVGLYGVMAYRVTQRRREFGIRLAIGARPDVIARLVVKEGAVTGLAGLALGIPFALLASHWESNQLYGLTAQDPALWALAALGILAVTMLAIWLPAHSAAAIDPQKILRED